MKNKIFKLTLAFFLLISLGAALNAEAFRGGGGFRGGYGDDGYRGGYYNRDVNVNRGYGFAGHGGYYWNGQHYNYYNNGRYYNYYYNGSYYNYYYRGAYYNNCNTVPGYWYGGIWYPATESCS